MTSLIHYWNKLYSPLARVPVESSALTTALTWPATTLSTGTVTASDIYCQFNLSLDATATSSDTTTTGVYNIDVRTDQGSQQTVATLHATGEPIFLSFFYDGGADTSVYVNGGNAAWSHFMPRKELISRKIKENLWGSRFHYQYVPSDISAAEIKALQLLRTLLMPADFRRYLKRGKVVVQGKSGIQYVITRQSHFVQAFFCGKLLARLCLYVPDPLIPPTDCVITRLMLARCEEKKLWEDANVYYSYNVDREYLGAVTALSQKFSEAKAFLPAL